MDFLTSDNPTQLNKDILTKEKTNTDLIKYLFLSYPFPNPSPLGQGIAAEPPERKRMEQKRQYKISFAMLRSRTSFLRVVYPCPYRRCNALKSSEKRTLSHNIPYWIESASGLSDCALLVAQQQRRKQSSRTLAQSLSLTTVFGFAVIPRLWLPARRQQLSQWFKGYQFLIPHVQFPPVLFLTASMPPVSSS